MLTLTEALNIIDGTAPFTVKVVKADQKLNTGGEIIDLGPAVRSWQPGMQVSFKSQEPARYLKAPHHKANGTRNIKILANGETKKIHIRLILEVNGTQVL